MRLVFTWSPCLSHFRPFSIFLFSFCFFISSALFILPFLHFFFLSFLFPLCFFVFSFLYTTLRSFDFYSIPASSFSFLYTILCHFHFFSISILFTLPFVPFIFFIPLCSISPLHFFHFLFYSHLIFFVPFVSFTLPLLHLFLPHPPLCFFYSLLSPYFFIHPHFFD